MAAVEDEGESAAVGQSEFKRFTPIGLLTAVLDTISQFMAQTIAALHNHGVGRLMQLKGCRGIHAIELAGGMVGDVEGIK